MKHCLNLANGTQSVHVISFTKSSIFIDHHDIRFCGIHLCKSLKLTIKLVHCIHIGSRSVAVKNHQKVLSRYLISECLFFAIFGVCDLEAYTNKFDYWIAEISFEECVSHQNDRFTNS